MQVLFSLRYLLKTIMMENNNNNNHHYNHNNHSKIHWATNYIGSNDNKGLDHEQTNFILVLVIVTLFIVIIISSTSILNGHFG